MVSDLEAVSRRLNASVETIAQGGVPLVAGAKPAGERFSGEKPGFCGPERTSGIAATIEAELA